MHVLEAINAEESIEDEYPTFVSRITTRMNEIEEGFKQIDEKVDGMKVPSKLSDLENDSNFVEDENYVHTDNNFTTEEKEKLKGLKNFDDTEIKEELGKKADSADLEGLASRTFVEERIGEIDLSGFATETYVNNKIGDIDTLLSKITDESEAI